LLFDPLARKNSLSVFESDLSEILGLAAPKGLESFTQPPAEN
jgi:hypothetical protein